MNKSNLPLVISVVLGGGLAILLGRVLWRNLRFLIRTIPTLLIPTLAVVGVAAIGFLVYAKLKN